MYAVHANTILVSKYMQAFPLAQIRFIMISVHTDYLLKF